MRFSAAPDVVGGRLSFAPTLRRRGPCFGRGRHPASAAGTGNGWGGPHLFPREQVQTSTGHGTRGALPQGPARHRIRRAGPGAPGAGSGRASGYDGRTMDLFSERADRLGDQEAPLAARMRPRTLEEFVGQGHVLGPRSALRALIEADEVRSVILWGPAGTGKTPLAHIIANA